MIYVCDKNRHLVCLPYSKENLHKMADELGIKRCWFHGVKHPHYDIPKKRIKEIMTKCKVISTRDLYHIIEFAILLGMDTEKRGKAIWGML
jgi:hypothetical protein